MEVGRYRSFELMRRRQKASIRGPTLLAAPHVPVSMLVAAHAAFDAYQTDIVLLMEDLATARPVDKLDGFSADESARVRSRRPL